LLILVQNLTGNFNLTYPKAEPANLELHLRLESDRRMFYYLARLHQNDVKDIYPIVIFSFDQPYRAEQDTVKIEFPNLKVLEFRFQAIHEKLSVLARCCDEKGDRDAFALMRWE
jgi:hypothetical protein